MTDDVERARDFRLVGLGALVLGALGLAAALAVPFLPAIAWAAALAVIAWPMHRWIARHLGRPGFAAGISTAIVTLVILGVGSFVGYHIASKAVDGAAAATERPIEASEVKRQASRVPVLGRAVGWMERAGVDLEEAIRGLIEPYFQLAADLAAGSVRGAIQALVGIFVLFYLFRDRDVFIRGVRAVLPMSREESDFLLTRAADSVHATLYATVLTSVIDATAFGVAFWLIGLPSPMLWASVMFVLSVLPVLGAGLVWVPAMIYLGANGHWGGAVVLAALGAVTATLVDNALYAKLAGDRLRLHDVPVMIAFLGGLALFGLSGMVLGPAILAVAEAALEVWKARMSGMVEAGSEAPQPVAAR